jgi:ubiquinone/menaquinone biosynthesis C-methylase UbiE|tara:strand:- start:450 stop:1307 length:858 start_codon:yes stop_codon:yes gene_type:complete
MKLKNCILCHSTNIESSHIITYEEKKYMYDFCKDCTFTFQNPWPDKKIEDIYNNSKYWNSTNVYNEDKNNQVKNQKNSYASYQNNRFVEAKKRYEKLRNYFSKEGSVLEIGCANGIFLNEFNENGWKCVGVDPAKEMIEMGKKKFNLNLIASKWEDLEIEDESNDLIYMWGTDGNFYHFQDGFEKIKKKLKTNGIYALTYQDFKHPIRKIFNQIKLQHHVLYNFSKNSIIYLLKKMNFEILEHRMTWQNSKLSHIKKILGLDTGGIDFNIKVPAISYNIVIARKI